MDNIIVQWGDFNRRLSEIESGFVAVGFGSWSPRHFQTTYPGAVTAVDVAGELLYLATEYDRVFREDIEVMRGLAFELIEADYEQARELERERQGGAGQTQKYG